MRPMRSLALPFLAMLLAAGPAAAEAQPGPGAMPVRVKPRGGVAYNPQLDAVGPAFGLDVGLGVLGDGRVAVGLAVDHLRFDYARSGVAVAGTAWADLEASLAVTPVLFELEGRLPIVGGLVGFVGGAAGPVFTRVTTRGTGGTARVPEQTRDELSLGGAVAAGLGLGLGPGRFTLEGRFHAISGEVDGAAKGVSAGGLSGQAGYELEL